MSKRPWISAEDDEVIRRYPTEITHAIAGDLGRSVGSVYQRAFVLGLIKTPEYLASPHSGRLDGGPTASSFVKGHATWNKGRPGSTGLHPNCRGTQFKQGQRGGRWVPLGTERVTRDGYLERKVHDDWKAQRGNWRMVHVLVWEAAKGPIPSGYVVVFRNGMRTSLTSEITKERLELVTRAELMRRNSRHTNYPPELNRLIQLKGALNRKINKRSKAA